jgi:hypothetical protein
LTFLSAVYIYSYNAKREYCNIFNGHNKHGHTSLLQKVFRMQLFYMTLLDHKISNVDLPSQMVNFMKCCKKLTGMSS